MNKSFVYPMLLPETAFILLSIHIITSLVTITIFIMLPVKVLKLCISAAKIIIELPRELAIDVYVRMRTWYKNKYICNSEKYSFTALSITELFCVS